jgi:hypothetical protein
VAEIRRLKPSVGRLRIPPKNPYSHSWRVNSNKKRTVRRREDFPPGTPLDTPCVIWQGAVDKDGYGKRKIRRKDGKEVVIGVHRWIIERVREYPLSPKQVVLHLCDNPPCYRYDHLTVGTIQENNADRHRKGRTKQTPQHMRGETNGRAKLTRKQVALIKIDYSAGQSISALARQHKVSRNTIYRVLQGLTWKEQEEQLSGEPRSPDLASGTVARTDGSGEP